MSRLYTILFGEEPAPEEPKYTTVWYVHVYLQRDGREPETYAMKQQRNEALAEGDRNSCFGAAQAHFLHDERVCILVHDCGFVSLENVIAFSADIRTKQILVEGTPREQE